MKYITIKSKYELKTGPTSITLPVSPSSIKHNVTVDYEPMRAIFVEDAQKKKNEKITIITYKGHSSGTLSFKLIIIDSAVIPSIIDSAVIPSIENKKATVKEQVDVLKDIVYYLNKDEHRSNIVDIEWGEASFEGCSLSKMNIDYTMFSNDAKLLRADIDLDFHIDFDKEMKSRYKTLNSPDMSRIRVLNDEDKLSLMCEEFYGDSTMQLQVAKENGIVNFRKLKAGTEVYFPPIKK
jgi:hypothetical protein